MWQSIKDIWLKANNHQKWFLLITISFFAFAGYLVSQVNVENIIVNTSRAKFELEKIHCIDSIKHDMWRHFKHRADSLSYEISVREAKILSLESN